MTARPQLVAVCISSRSACQESGHSTRRPTAPAYVGTFPRPHDRCQLGSGQQILCGRRLVVRVSIWLPWNVGCSWLSAPNKAGAGCHAIKAPSSYLKEILMIGCGRITGSAGPLLDDPTSAKSVRRFGVRPVRRLGLKSLTGRCSTKCNDEYQQRRRRWAASRPDNIRSPGEQPMLNRSSLNP